MIKVVVCGCLGRMGRTCADAISAAEDMEVVAGVDVVAGEEPLITECGAKVPLFTDLAAAIETTEPDVLVDFTRPDVVAGDIEVALAHDVNCCIGTTGLSSAKVAELSEGIKGDTCLFIAPNFTTGAVLMMKFAEMAAKFFPDIEIIEFHHDGKKDAPSGTAIQTAQRIAEAKALATNAPGRETELEGHEGARGDLVEGIPVHSVRTAGYVAHQEVILGSVGQTLTIRHDSIDRASYMPGVLLAVRSVMERSGLIVGLDKLM